MRPIHGAKQNPPFIRAPNDVLKGLVDYWGAGKATYEPCSWNILRGLYDNLNKAG